MKILIPDFIAGSFARALTNDGFEVEIITGGRVIPRDVGEALLQTIVDEPDKNYLVIFNLPSPRVSTMDGFDLAEKLVKIGKPNVPVILLSSMIDIRLKERHASGQKQIPANILKLSSYPWAPELREGEIENLIQVARFIRDNQDELPGVPAKCPI